MQAAAALENWLRDKRYLPELFFARWFDSLSLDHGFNPLLGTTLLSPKFLNFSEVLFTLLGANRGKVVPTRLSPYLDSSIREWSMQKILAATGTLQV